MRSVSDELLWLLEEFVVSALTCRDRRAQQGGSTDIDEHRLGRLLDVSPLLPTASEAHGMLCGFVCGGDADPVNTWLDQLLPATDQGDGSRSETRASLRALAEGTHVAIAGPDLGLRLLLPDEDRPLLERATALCDWVQGFLYALGVLGVSSQELSEQGDEILRDLIGLTKMDLEILDESEENEEALTQVTEFVRVAVMLIREERSSPREEGERA